jgi:hypothetical protein
MCIICKNTRYVPDIYMKSVYFSAFILHISGTDKCKIGVRYLIFQPVYMAENTCASVTSTFGISEISKKSDPVINESETSKLSKPIKSIREAVNIPLKEMMGS